MATRAPTRPRSTRRPESSRCCPAALHRSHLAQPGPGSRSRIVVDMAVGGDGAVTASDVYRAMVRNHAKLAYDGVAAWLEASGPAPERSRPYRGCDEQVRLQDRRRAGAAARRQERGRARFRHAPRSEPCSTATVSRTAARRARTARSELIENFMVAANGVTASSWPRSGFPRCGGCVRSPERWPRIVELARRAR